MFQSFQDYLNKIISSLNVRSSRVSSAPVQPGGSQQNVQLQGGNILDAVSSFTPLKVKEMIL